MMLKQTWVRALLAISIIGVSVAYLMHLVGRTDQAILELAMGIPVWVLCWSILLSTVGGFFNALLWYRLIKAQNVASSFSGSYWAWSVSRVFRYIPGKVFGYAVRHGLEKSSLKQGVSASLNELLIVLGALALLGVCFFLFSVPIASVLLSIPVIVVVFCRQIAISFLRLLPDRFTHFFHPEGLGNPGKMLRGMVFVMPAMLAHTAAFYLVMTSGLGETAFSFIQSASVLYFSGLAGQLAIVVPGGLGVREAVMAYMSSLSGIGDAVAVCAALVSRIILLLAELVNILLSGLLRSICK